MNLVAVSGVSFGGTPAANYTVNSANSITATSPAHSAGDVDITVTTATGTSPANANLDGFDFTAPPPTVTGVRPHFGPSAGGTTVVISGTSFIGVTAVDFGGTAATTFTANSDHSISAVSPPEAAGMVDVTVTTATGASPVTSGDHFTFTAPPPAISGLSPASGSGDGGESVTIAGSAFVDVLGISFGGAPAAAYTVNSATSVTAIAPAHAAGAVDVRLTTLAGTSPLDPIADQFTYTAGSGGTTAPLTTTQLGPQASAEGDAVSLAVSATDTNSTSVMNYSISGQPQGLSISEQGVISGTVAFGDAATNGGIYTVTVSMADGTGAAASQSFAWFVTATYQQPTLTAPAAQTNAEGDTVSLALTSIDPQGNPLTFAAAGLPVGLSIDPASGTISGTVDYSDAETNGGHYTVLVSADDGQGGHAAAVFAWTITHTPRAPTMDALGGVSNAEGQTVSILVQAQSPDGSPLSYIATGLPSGVSIDSQSGLIDGTLDYSDAELGMNSELPGTYNVTATATDATGLSASQTFVWTVSDTPRAPIVTDPPSQSNQEGDIVNLPITASSPDGDTLSYSAAGLPSGLSIDPTAGVIGGTGGLIGGTIDYTAAATQNGSYNVTVTVSAVDSSRNVLASASQSFSWQVTAVTGSLSITNPGAQASAEGAAVLLQTQAADPDGNDITRSVTGLPAGLTMDANGLITGTVSYSAAESSSEFIPSPGQYAVTLTAVDSAGETASQSFTWTISDTYRPPVVAQIAHQSSHEGDSVSLATSATAPEGNAFTFSATGLPGGLAIGRRRLRRYRHGHRHHRRRGQPNVHLDGGRHRPAANARQSRRPVQRGRGRGLAALERQRPRRKHAGLCGQWLARRIGDQRLHRSDRGHARLQRRRR